MNKLEAYRLLDAVEWTLRTGQAECRKLGNGEWIVYLLQPCYFLWDEQSWIDYCALKSIRQVRSGQRWASGDSYINGIDTTAEYTLAIA